ARVRAQVAATPARAPWHRWWPAAAAGVAVVSLVAIGDLRTADVEAPRSAGAAVVAPQRTRVEPMNADVVGPTAAASHGVAPPAARHAFPQVLISPDDAGAVRLLLANAPDGISPSAADDSTGQPLTVTQIDLPLIEVAPLAELTQLEPGERQ
ncbi:MAG TPA: hypothetical protein VIY56_01450, partial [Vicinamibacterales bacterium]